MMISVGLIQSDIQPHKMEENLQHYEALLSKNIQKPVDLLVFPEMFACGFSPSLREEAEQMDGKSISFLQQTAQRYHSNVVASLPILEGDKVVNRLVWLSPEGLCGQYDKKHLFFGDEERICTPGTARTIVQTLGYKFFPLICFDVRFPKWSCNHYSEAGFAYDCLVYIANFPAPREQMLLKLAAARAIENQAYVLVANRIGTDGNGFAHQGGTAVIHPNGEIVKMADMNVEQVLLCDLDFDQLQTLRNRFPVAEMWD